jgi:hypothetical protein
MIIELRLERGQSAIVTAAFDTNGDVLFESFRQHLYAELARQHPEIPFSSLREKWRIVRGDGLESGSAGEGQGIEAKTNGDGGPGPAFRANESAGLA